MFWNRKKPYPEYRETPAFIDPVGQLARIDRGLPMTSYRGGTGIQVLGSLNALNPAMIKPSRGQVITSPYGRSTEPNYPPILMPLSRNDPGTGSI